MILADANDRLLRISEVKDIAGMGTSTIYRKVAEGNFPPPVRLSGGMSRWRKSDIEQWIQALPLTTAEARVGGH